MNLKTASEVNDEFNKNSDEKVVNDIILKIESVI